MDNIEFRKFNNQLIDDFGYFNFTKNPKFRLVWSHDELEKRLVTHTVEGLELLQPKVEERPKYRQWADNRWILEKLTEVPTGEDELTVHPTSYEPIWTFTDRKGEYLEPNYKAAKFIINTLLGQTTSSGNMAKYRTSNEEERQARIREIDELEELLYGNESKVGDALARDSAVGYGSRQRNDGFNATEKVNKAMLN